MITTFNWVPPSEIMGETEWQRVGQEFIERIRQLESDKYDLVTPFDKRISS